MNLRFDNSKAGDGNKRVEMPGVTNRSGGGFSFGKCVIFIVIAALVVSYVFLVIRDYDVESYNKLTMSDWMTMLNEAFGRNDDTEYGEEAVTGHDIVKTTFGELNDKRLEWVLKDSVINDKALEQLAIDNKIITKRQLKKELTRKEGEAALNSFIEFYSNPDNYPVYEEVTLNDNVENIVQNEIIDHDEEYSKCMISKVRVDEGKVLIINSDGDEPIARRVVSSESKEDGTTEVMLEDVENIEDVIDSLSFSGYGYLLDSDAFKERTVSKGDLGDVEIEVTRALPQDRMNNKSPIAPLTAHAFDYGDTSKAMNVSMKVSYSNENGKSTFGNQISVNDSVLFDASDEFGEEGEHDNWSVSGSVEGTIELQNLTVSAEGVIFEGKNDYVQVLATSDVVFDLKIEGNFERSYKLCTIPVKIFPNPGIGVMGEGWFTFIPELYMDINLYLVISADGSLEIEYTIDDAAIGFKVAKDSGLEPIKSHNGKTLEISGRITADAGLKTEVDLKVNFLHWQGLLIADPCVYAGIKARAEILEKNKGYEDYLPCVALDLRGPIVNLTYAQEEGTPLYEILDFCGVKEKKLEIFTAETAPIKKEWHVETDLDMNIDMKEGGIENCTHIAKEDLKDMIDDEVDKAEDDAMQKLDQWLADLFRKTCGEECGNGCN